MARNSYLLLLLGVFSPLRVALAIAPADRADWLLENVLLVAGVAALVATRGVFPLSKVSCTACRWT